MKDSGTDWERLARMTDDEIDTSDIPPLGPEFWDRAVLEAPAREMSDAVRVDQDVLAWFRSFGEGYQKRINDVLRAYVRTQKAS